MEKAAEIRQYLDDLGDIREEHLKAADMCIDCVNLAKAGYTGGCSLISVITVEIVTYQRKLDEIS